MGSDRMTAAVLRNLNEPLTFERVPRPIAREGEVVVALKAAALNHRDVWIRKGLYPGIVLPTILGSDGAGVVVEAGDQQLNGWVGKSVLINPALHWGEVPTHYGPNFQILGLETEGTFAAYVCIAATNIVEMPRHLSYTEGASIPLAGLTAWRCLVARAGVKAGENVLVTGAGGGVSQFVMQFAIATGANVWVTSGSDEKIRKARELGVNGGVNYQSPEWHRELLTQVSASRQGYFDVIIDGAGGAGFQKLIDVAAPGARICFYGGTAGPITDLIPAKIFFKQLTIMGSTMGTPEEFKSMIRFVEEKKIFPVIDSVFPFKQIEKGFERMEQSLQFGKIAFTR